MGIVHSLPKASEALSPRDRLRGRIQNEYVTHLRELENVFNGHAGKLGLGVRIDVTKAVTAALNFDTIRKVSTFLDRADDSGVLHDAQLMTALDCVAQILAEPGRNGLVIGAMQSGKTTTSLALQFAGPIIYLLTGRAHYPVYLITSHTSQEDQTKIELKKFLDFYGDVEVFVDEDHRCTLIEYTENLGLDLIFEVSPTIETYRHNVLQGALPDIYMGPTLEDFVQRRVHGRGVERVVNLCRRASDRGFSPLLMIDEPQYGASDRLVSDGEGGVEWRSCVLNQIFQSIEDELGVEAVDHVFVGLSATPYELVGVEAVWQVKQYLSSAYTGFNYFCGEVIDGDARVNPPETLSFSEYATRSDISFFSMIDLSAYGGSRATFDRFTRASGYAGNQARYRARVEDALRAAIYDMVDAEGGDPIGICVRLFNDNRRSQNLIRRLGLSPDRVEVIEWFGSDFRGQSVKRAIESRKRKDLPFLVAVTNRARMGDAFPSSVRWFVDFSRQASTLNALLQGLLGRACGYNKNSVVVLSDPNTQLVRDYQQTRGGLIYVPSPHSVIVGPYRRGAPTSILRVSADFPDPVVARFFERLNREVVDLQVDQGAAAFSTRRTRGGYRTAPILQIAEQEGLFDHLETAEIRERLYPSFAEGFRIARAGDQVERSRSPEEPIGYSFGPDGGIRFTFRWVGDDGPNHAGIQSRGYGARDAAERARAGDKLEPQIQVRKRDLQTGQIIFDKNAPSEDQQPGQWEASALILPLLRPVRELKSGELTLPKERSAYSNQLTDEEKIAAGYTLTN
ncbi:MAG TPA: hypothetical protein VIT45_04185 [Allosphingosinicella sp.]